MPVSFTKDGAKRIASATRIVEKLVRGSGTGPAHRRPTGILVGFWAKIGDRSGKRYSWEQLKALDLSDPEILGPDTSELLEGDSSENFAFEILGSQNVLKGSVVWVTPGIGQDFYVFQYAPGLRIAKVGSSDIGPRGSSGNPGQATVTLYKRDSSGNLVAESGSDVATSVTVYNWTKATVKKNRFIQIGYSQQDKVWYIVGEDCADTSTGGS